MWNVEDIEAIPVELDFSGSGQDRCSTTAIEAGGVRLFNALELVEIGPSATQVEVCEECGFPGCSSGGWVAFRRIGAGVVWIPAWDAMAQDADMAPEYEPPSCLLSKGAPIFSAASWEQLRALHGELPSSRDLAWINSREAARLCQWYAPGRLLGCFPGEPRIRRELLVAVADGDLEVEASLVDECLHAYFGGVGDMAPVPEALVERPIEFWLDLPGTPGWRSFAHVGNELCFVFDGNTALRRHRGSSSHSV